MKDTQNKMILAHLQTHRDAGITPGEALELYSCMRLASRISDLRRMGHSIETRKVKALNKFGKQVEFARYVLKD